MLDIKINEIEARRLSFFWDAKIESLITSKLSNLDENELKFFLAKSMKTVIHCRREEKIQYIQNLFLNILAEEDKKRFDKLEIYLDVLDKLTYSEISLMVALSNKANTSSVERYTSNWWVDFDQYFYQKFRNELSDMKEIEPLMLGLTRTPFVSIPQGYTSHSRIVPTYLFNDFINNISTLRSSIDVS